MKHQTPIFRDGALHVDGQPLFLYSGEVQQYRLPAELWRDRLEKCRAMGLNGVGVYFGWNFHSDGPGSYDFNTPDRDLGDFLRTAAELGLRVIVRPGPYVCNEWDLGGYPGWLLARADGGGDWRTADPAHLDYCREWLQAVDAVIAPWQEGREGSVALYQVENEHFQGDAEFLDGLARQIRDDGIEVPLIGNGGGSAYRCGSKLVADGADMYTTLWEQWRWRGWFTMLQRVLPPDVPMMILEYRAGGHPSWGQPLIDENTSPPEFMMGQTRLFIGLGANVTNFFVAAGGITPVGLGSDHNCTPYAADGPLSHWGGLGPKAYRIRLLGELIGALNRQLAQAKPRVEAWGSDNARVEAPVRVGPAGTFFFPVNFEAGAETFRLVAPDGTVYPADGDPLYIGPRTSQCYPAEVDLGDGWHLEFCTVQILKIWQEDGALRLVVYGDDGHPGRLTVRRGDERYQVHFTCATAVNRVRGNCAGLPVDCFAVTEAVAERTWFVDGQPVFGNLDLVRPGTGTVRAELADGEPLRLLVPDCDRLTVDGETLIGTIDEDDLVEFVAQWPALPAPKIELGLPEVRHETAAWLFGDGDFEPLAGGETPLVANGLHHYRARFTVSGRPPKLLGFLSLAGVEANVYLNRVHLGAFPSVRPRSALLDGETRVDWDVRHAIRTGENQLDVVCYQLGRHNHGRPQSTGINRPVVLYTDENTCPLPRWYESPTIRRRWLKPELEASRPPAFADANLDGWQEVDLRVPRGLPADWGGNDWLSVRWYRCQADIPRPWRNRPLFLQIPAGAEAWLYVNGAFHERVDCDRTRIFDLCDFADQQSLDLVLGLRFYWRGPFCLTTPPTLRTFPHVIRGDWSIRHGSEGEHGQWLAQADPWQSAGPPGENARFWYRRQVRIRQTPHLWAPLYVELDDRWRANVTIYWNGHPIGLYSETGPDRRFFIPPGRIEAVNTIALVGDGLASPPAHGDLTFGTFARQRQIELRV